jgi:hypothetical protein
MLFSVLDKTLTSNANNLGTAVAQRAFETLYPQLVVRSAVDLDWRNREVVIEKALVRCSFICPVPILFGLHRIDCSR